MTGAAALQYPHVFSQVKCKSTKYDDISKSLTPSAWKEEFEKPDPELDWTFLLNEDNTASIAANIESRKGVGDIHKVVRFHNNIWL